MIPDLFFHMDCDYFGGLSLLGPLYSDESPWIRVQHAKKDGDIE